MLTSDGRIVITHAGRLPRPPALADLHRRRSRGEAVDPSVLRETIRTATEACVAAQVAVGIDIGNDGEQARESFFTYVQHRMTGFGGESRRRLMRDLLDHPDFIQLAFPRSERIKVSLMTAPAAIGHPEVVADRLVSIARSVGDPTRVIAGTDCGFDTSAGIGDVAPTVVWAKLRALRAGADLASERLF